MKTERWEARVTDRQSALPARALRRAVEAGMTIESWRALGDWLENLVEWHYAATLTFRSRVSRSRAIDLAKTWAADLAREIVGAHIFLVVGVEAHALGGHHVHLLAHVEHSGENIDEDVLAETWLRSSRYAGPRSTFALFESGAGGGFYLVKDGDWDFFVACTRGRGCRKGRGCRGEERFKRFILER